MKGRATMRTDLYPLPPRWHNTATLMKSCVSFGLIVAVAFVAGCRAIPEDEGTPGPGNANIQVPGIQHDGTVLLPNQWSLRPVGKQVEVGDFPVNIALHPKGK